MDEFAQTRGADDLFEDDFTPIDAPISQTVELTPSQQQPQLQRSSGSDRAIRGRGNQISRQPRQSRQQQTSPSKIVAPDVTNGILETSSTNQFASPQNGTDPDSTPQQLKPPSAVRGDRTLTGGTLKPKLTEDELSARMAAAKLNNAKRAEAHRLAEADEANFQQREAQASQKRKEEGAARRAMNQEREKNRMRKLGAQGGREWDEGKAEQEPERGSQYRRGAHGGVAYDRNSPRGEHQGRKFNEVNERREGFVPRGGGRGRGGRVRGNFVSNRIVQQAAPDPVNDFPALPSAPDTHRSSQDLPPALPTEQKNESPTQRLPSGKPTQDLQPAARGESWAEQVDRVQDSTAPEGEW
ncbi:hypothetical protein IMSHALPRED_011077 [Imshaugia aleurites]|uniref:Uncharacterized protein n=1 Tax=Imshaugia aleurites TaxID=172621 RepID=A0A8H3IR59_9LECA|nr:hypothetical protein IMSHALPRED_011077 [Imshaugia aleurites]